MNDTPSMRAAPGSFLALLDDGERDALLGLGVRRSFERRSVLMFEHDPDERVMLVLEGRVKVARADEEGREMLLSIRDPGDILGELAVIDSEPRIATVTALEPVRALVMPSTTFRSHLETTPKVAVKLLEVIARRFRETTVKRSQSTASDTLGRLAARIVELAERYGEPADGAITVALPLSREELAGWTGSSRAGVAEALRMLRELGWVQGAGRNVTILDMEALRARAA